MPLWAGFIIKKLPLPVMTCLSTGQITAEQSTASWSKHVFFGVGSWSLNTMLFPPALPTLLQARISHGALHRLRLTSWLLLCSFATAHNIACCINYICRPGPPDATSLALKPRKKDCSSFLGSYMKQKGSGPWRLYMCVYIYTQKKGWRAFAA